MSKSLSSITSSILVGLLVATSTTSSVKAQNAIRGPGVIPTKKTVPSNAAPKVPEVPPSFVLPDPPIPVRQARELGLDQCAPVLDLMSREALTAPYDVQSGWSRGDPTHHVFQTVAALRNPTNNPQDGLAALIAAPVGAGGCDGVVVQVFPLAGDCQNAQKVMLQTGTLVGPMLGTRIMLDARGHRVILLPAFANTCIAISVDTRFGAEAQPAQPR